VKLIVKKGVHKKNNIAPCSHFSLKKLMQPCMILENLSYNKDATGKRLTSCINTRATVKTSVATHNSHATGEFSFTTHIQLKKSHLQPIQNESCCIPTTQDILFMQRTVARSKQQNKQKKIQNATCYKVMATKQSKQPTAKQQPTVAHDKNSACSMLLAKTNGNHDGIRVF
jgi:hypothetical protein